MTIIRPMIAILGSGRVASSLATGLSMAGHQVIVGTYHPGDEKAWTESTVRFAGHRDAISASDIVFNATPGDTSV